MSQKIFKLGLSVETVSVYLMCCSLADTDTTISTKKLSEMWNSTRSSLLEALKDLETRNILRRIISDRSENTVYILSDVKNWKLL
jgi:predicted transcriptional regulator